MMFISTGRRQREGSGVLTEALKRSDVVIMSGGWGLDDDLPEVVSDVWMSLWWKI